MIKIYIIILFLISLSSCSHTYYMPSTHNVPLLQAKGEYRANIVAGSNDNINSLNVQAAYAISDEYAVIANYMYAKGGEEEKNNWGKADYIDFAYGYYYNINTQFVFEVFGGAGYSVQKHYYGEKSTSTNSNLPIIEGTSHLNYSRIFLQPSIAFTSDELDIAFTPCISQLYFSDIRNNIFGNQTEYNAVEDINNNKISLLFEPAVTLRLGYEYLKTQTQISMLKNFTNPNLNFSEIKISFGISIAFSEKFRNN